MKPISATFVGFLMCALLVAALPRNASATNSAGLPNGAVAILYFNNQGNPDLEPLRVGLSQILITQVQETATRPVVERARLQEILDELELGHSGKVDEGTAAAVGKLLGAHYLVMGSYFELVGTLRIDARLVRVETGEILASHGVQGQVSDFLSMTATLGTSLSSSLAGVSGERGSGGSHQVDPKPQQARTAGNAQPTDNTGAAEKTVEPSTALQPPGVAQRAEAPLEAALAFSEGLIALDRKDMRRARESFQAAVAADPNLEAAKAELARMEL